MKQGKGYYKSITVDNINPEDDQVYDMKKWNILYFLQVLHIYSHSYLKLHNLIDLTLLRVNVVDLTKVYDFTPLNHSMIKAYRCKIFIS